MPPRRRVHPDENASEKALEEFVVDLAKRTGWTRWHVSDARIPVGGKLVGDPRVAGLPDEILAHPLHGIIFAELKARLGKLRPKQVEALEVLGAAASQAALTGCKVRVHLWRPADVNRIIVPVLTRGEGPIVYGW